MLVFLSSYGLRLQRHPAFRARSRMILLDLRMHGAGVDHGRIVTGYGFGFVASTMSVTSAVMLRKLDLVWGMRVAAVRHSNDGLELVRLGNAIRGFEGFILRAKGKSLAHTAGSHRFDCHGCARGDETRLLALVIEKQSETRRHIRFKNGDLNKAVAEVYEEAL